MPPLVGTLGHLAPASEASGSRSRPSGCQPDLQQNEMLLRGDGWWIGMIPLYQSDWPTYANFIHKSGDWPITLATWS